MHVIMMFFDLNLDGKMRTSSTVSFVSFLCLQVHSVIDLSSWRDSPQ